MSMEINVLFRGKLPAKAALARAMKALDFPLTIPPPPGSLEKQKGFLPMRLRREETGAEFDVFEGRDNVKEVVGKHIKKIDQAFDRSANFRFGGDENEMVAATCAAAALAKLVNGVVYEPEDDRLRAVDAAIARAKRHLDELKPEERRFGTRPSDVKRYVKPLLKERDDLVLVDRLLLIRPVRHLIRGAYFEPRRNRYFRIWRHVNPLYAPAGTTYGDDTHVVSCDVWDFEPLLIDALAEDVFGDVGRIVTLNDFADFTPALVTTPLLGARVVSLVLAGERDRAAEYVAQIQSDEAMNGYAKEFVRKQWDRVSGDIDALCKKFHAQEAATVKALKLEHVWEPSPFPVELPAAQRARVSEPSFSKAPWISTPSWLYGEMPEHPGEVRFGKSIRSRNGRAFFVIPLTREEAKKRHLASEPYARAERLADGTLLWINRGGRDLNDSEKPQNPNYRPSTELHITWVKSPYVLHVNASQDFDDQSVIVWWMLEVDNHETGEDVWLSYADGRENKRSIHDWRSGKKVYSEAPLTAAERKLVRCRMPGFGDYTKLLTRISSLLEMAGYGPWP